MAPFDTLSPAEIARRIDALRAEHVPGDRHDENHACTNGRDLRSCTFCADCTRCWRCTYCRECTDCTACAHCVRCDAMVSCNHCHDSRRCMRSSFVRRCEDCVDCVHCFGCVGLRGRQFHIFNEPYDKKAYFDALAAMGVG